MVHWETSPERCSPRRRLPRGASSVRTGPYNFWRCIVRGASTWAIGSGVWSFSRRGVGSGWMAEPYPKLASHGRSIGVGVALARIGIDASIMLHGERAGLRHTRNLLDPLLRLHPEDDWALLYFDRRGTTPGRVPLPATGARERVSRLPMRLLSTPWRMLGWPPVERWLGRIDVLYAPDLHFPPARRAPILCTIRGVAYLAIPHLCESDTVSSLVRAFTYARRRAQHFLAVSESTRQDLLRYTDVPAERSEEHTSELQSLRHLVCRLLLEKTKNSITHCATTFCKALIASHPPALTKNISVCFLSTPIPGPRGYSRWGVGTSGVDPPSSQLD